LGITLIITALSGKFYFVLEFAIFTLDVTVKYQSSYKTLTAGVIT